MKKLFLAIAIDDLAKKAATPIFKKIKTRFDEKEIEGKWSKPENWHITLVFLGDREESEISSIWEKALEVAQSSEAFELKLEGVGAFPDAREARIVWLGVQKSQKLLDLQTRLEKALGIEPQYVYTPHMTVGRLRNLKSVWDIIKPFAKTKVGKLHVNEIILYESIQAGVHPIYNVIHRSAFSAQRKEQEVTGE